MIPARREAEAQAVAVREAEPDGSLSLSTNSVTQLKRNALERPASRRAPTALM